MKKALDRLTLLIILCGFYYFLYLGFRVMGEFFTLERGDGWDMVFKFAAICGTVTGIGIAVLVLIVSILEFKSTQVISNSCSNIWDWLLLLAVTMGAGILAVILMIISPISFTIYAIYWFIKTARSAHKSLVYYSTIPPPSGK